MPVLDARHARLLQLGAQCHWRYRRGRALPCSLVRRTAQLPRPRAARGAAERKGVEMLCDAVGDGAIPNCQALYLNSNDITSLGAHYVAGIIASGAFDSLVSLWLQHNRIGDNGALALADAIAATRRLQEGLRYLRLDENSLTCLGRQLLTWTAKSWCLNRLDV